MTFNTRAIHRDFGYFYMGLIISFAFSGIMLNHRQNWHPEKYTVQTNEIMVQLPQNQDSINENFVKGLTKQLAIQDKFRRHVVRKGELQLSYEKHDVAIDIKTGKGEIVAFNKTPFIAQTLQLHKDTSVWWIYYSDIFALSLILIAVTGAIMIPQGQFSFKSRGWKLALLGIIFPLIFLFFLS